MAQDSEVAVAQQTGSLMINKLLQVSFLASPMRGNRVVLVDAPRVADLPCGQVLIARKPVRKVAVFEDALQLSVLTLAVPHQAQYLATVLRVQFVKHVLGEVVVISEYFFLVCLHRVIGRRAREVVRVTVVHAMQLRVKYFRVCLHIPLFLR